MAEPFIGQIVMFGGNFAPRNWALCDGQLLAISQNTALFSILGTTYGGDGRTTFGLPDLRGRVALHAGTGPGLSTVRLGQRGGAETAALTVNNMPSHSHQLQGYAQAGNSASPNGGLPALDGTGFTADYHNSPSTDQIVPMSSQAIPNTGGSQPFNIRDPYNTVNYIIALFGVFPSRN